MKQTFKNITNTGATEPIALIISNSSDKAQGCKLFFGDESNNYGNSDYIKIESKFGAYANVVESIRKNTLFSSLIRFESENYGQLNQIMVMIFGDETSIPIISYSYDGERYGSKIKDIPYDIVIDKDMHLEITILPKNELIMTFFEIKSDYEMVIGRRQSNKPKSSNEMLENLKRFFKQQEENEKQRRNTKNNI